MTFHNSILVTVPKYKFRGNRPELQLSAKYKPLFPSCRTVQQYLFFLFQASSDWLKAATGSITLQEKPCWFPNDLSEAFSVLICHCTILFFSAPPAVYTTKPQCKGFPSLKMLPQLGISQIGFLHVLNLPSSSSTIKIS